MNTFCKPQVTYNIFKVMQIGLSRVKPSYYERIERKTKSTLRKNQEYSTWPRKSLSFRFPCHFLGLTTFKSSKRINYSRDTFSRSDLMQQRAASIPQAESASVITGACVCMCVSIKACGQDLNMPINHNLLQAIDTSLITSERTKVKFPTTLKK